MKKNLYTLIILLSPFLVFCQSVEVDGEFIADSIDVNAGLIKNLADPVNTQDAATKSYVDAIKDDLNEDLLDAGLNGIVKDIDGNIYKTVKIGTQVWMAENLKTTRFNDGTIIPKVTNSSEWTSLNTPSYCWYVNDSTRYSELYGALYNYYTIADTTNLNVCPIGWDVPKDTDWDTLANFLIDNGFGYQNTGTDIGKSMAERYRWASNSTSGNVGNETGRNNITGFSGLPGGLRFNSGGYGGILFTGYWWSSTENDSSSSWFRGLNSSINFLNRSLSAKKAGLSVRCLRD